MKTLKIIGSVILIVIILLILFAFYEFRYGFKNFKTGLYQIPQQKYKTWDEVLKNPVDLKITRLQTGTVTAGKNLQSLLNKNNPNINKINLQNLSAPVLVYYINHQKYGDILIDVGFDDSVAKNTSYKEYPLSFTIFQKIMGFKNKQEKGQDMASLIKKYNINPKKIFFTHLHSDHIAGLLDLPDNIEIILCENELTFFNKAASGFFLKSKKNMQAFNFDNSISLPPFDKAIDLFGDGSLWAIFTPGHTDGHVSYLVNAKSGPVLITGDACMFNEAFKYGVEPFTMSKVGMPAAAKSLKSLMEFKNMHPETKVYVGHDL